MTLIGTKMILLCTKNIFYRISRFCAKPNHVLALCCMRVKQYGGFVSYIIFSNFVTCNSSKEMDIIKSSWTKARKELIFQPLIGQLQLILYSDWLKFCQLMK